MSVTKTLLVLFIVLYSMIGYGTWIGFNYRYEQACPNESFTYGPLLAGALWPLFAGAQIGGMKYGTVNCGNKL